MSIQGRKASRGQPANGVTPQLLSPLRCGVSSSPLHKVARDRMRELPCPGCGALFQDIDGPVHRYMESSAGCWAAYGEVLAREYTDPRYAHIHRLTVDAYAVQHPGRSSPQSIQSVAVHLISLCLILEYDVDMHRATEAIGVAIQAKGKYRWLPPPVGTYARTVADVQKACTVQEHHDLVHAWAKCVWSFWSEHHATIHTWLPSGNLRYRAGTTPDLGSPTS